MPPTRIFSLFLSSSSLTTQQRTNKQLVLHGNIKWVLDSAKNSERMDEAKYTLDNKKYDKARKAAEKAFDFDLSSLVSSRASNASAKTGVFKGQDIYFCDGVVGEKFPNLSELRQIVKCGGGTILSHLGRKKVDSLIVVTSNGDEDAAKTKKQMALVEKNAPSR